LKPKNQWPPLRSVLRHEEVLGGGAQNVSLGKRQSALKRQDPRQKNVPAFHGRLIEKSLFLNWKKVSFHTALKLVNFIIF
jgi:hypothetical protein